MGILYDGGELYAVTHKGNMEMHRETNNRSSVQLLSKMSSQAQAQAPMILGVIWEGLIN